MELTPASYTVTRLINSPIENVYEAWTNPDQLATWYGPVGLTCPRESVTLDVKVGGNWSATVVDPTGGQHQFKGEFREVIPLEKLIYTLDYSNPAMPNMPKYPDGLHEVVTLTFENKNGSTQLTFHQDGFLPEKQVPLAQAGMESYFDSLVNFLN